MSMRLLILLVLLVPGVQPASRVVPAPPEYAKARDFVQKAVADGLVPSVAIGVIKDGALVWAEAFGLADREKNITATPDTIYWLASVSKPLTATGLMQLVERGTVDLDQPANTYLGDAKLKAYRGSADVMTVRRLANHTAGLPTHYNFFYGTSPPTTEETIRRYGFASLEPGKQLQYSNLAYGILGHIVERGAKMPWRQYQEKNLYDRLKMTRTSDRIRPGFERDEAIPYVADVAGRFIQSPRYDFDHRPASAIFSTVHDLARFVRMYLNGGELDGTRVLQAASVKEMLRLTGESGPGAGYGVAWQTIDFGGHRGVAHGGNMPGVATHVNMFPQDRAATIVLTNGDNRQFVQELTRKLGQLLYPDVPDLPATSGTASPRTQSPAALTPAALAGAWKGRLVHYDGDIPLELTIKGDGVIDIAFGNRQPVGLRDPVLTEASMAGHIDTNFRAQDGYWGRSNLRFALTLRDGKLEGVCSAFAPNYFMLPYWVELTR